MVKNGLGAVVQTLIVMLSGCSQTRDLHSADAIPINKSLYSDSLAANVISYSTLFTLTPSQYDDIERFIQRPHIAPLASFIQARHYLLDTLLRRRDAQLKIIAGLIFMYWVMKPFARVTTTKRKCTFFKLLKNAPYFHPGWLELAKAQAVQGKFDIAKQALEKALALSSRSEDARRYQAKLSLFE